MNALDFLRSVGKHVRLSDMLARESVRSRLDSQRGLSFTEFSYQLLQANDFYHLRKHYGCEIQIGGSDQWGNILAGCDLVHKKLGTGVHGITIPLITTKSGEKFGKSAGNAIWLDRTKTSVFDFYQFFMRTDDAQVRELLLYFTFLCNDAIEQIMVEQNVRVHVLLIIHSLSIIRLINLNDWLKKSWQRMLLDWCMEMKD